MPDPRNPNVGKLVRCVDNDLGIAKVFDTNRETAILEYFDSPASSSWPQREVQITSLRAVEKLDEQTRVYFFDDDAGFWRMGRVHGQVDHEVFIDLPNKEQTRRHVRDVHIRWNRPVEDPWEHLSARLTETPFFHQARSGLVAHLIRQRAISRGMTALLSSPVSLEPYQIEVVRRVLNDPLQRYLLADEVGLGKTIEAGVILRQHILDQADNHRVLVISPAILVAQWRSELAGRCQVGTEFGHQIKVAAIEDIESWQNEQPSFLVLDEAHQLARGAVEGASDFSRKRFEAVRRLSHPSVCPHLLLLSATPVLRNEQGFLSLLHLLDPAVYDLTDVASFKLRVETRQELADLFAAFTEDQQPFFLEGSVDQLVKLFPNDVRLAELLRALRPILTEDIPGDERSRPLVRQIRTHLSETYRLHRRLLRNRRGGEIADLLPGRKKWVSLPWNDSGLAQAEDRLDQWRARAAAAMWGREESAECTALARIFAIFLESLWGDPLAFLCCVRSRLGGRWIDTSEDFGLLVDEGRRRTIVTTPLFADETSQLEQLVELTPILRSFREAALRQMADSVIALLQNELRVVCMTSSPALADELYHELLLRHPGHVTRHGEDQAQWSERWAKPGAHALICDAKAEEGVNLQGGNACLLHLDLPLSPNRIEQRMGRVDRFGVGKKVLSFGLEPAGVTYWKLWTQSLDEAWQVFSRSISSLQYVVEEKMAKLEQRMFLDGASAIREAAEELKAPGGLERELRLILNQDELDSIESATSHFAAELAECIEDYEVNAGTFQEEFEEWLVGCLHFEKIGVPDHASPVVRYHFARPDRGKRTLLPFSDFRERFGEAIDLNGRHPVLGPAWLTRALTFRRETARHRRIGLARLGNPLIEAVQRQLRWDDRGTSFAMWRFVEDAVPGTWFRLDFIVEADLASLGESPDPALVRGADAAFPPIIETLWVSSDLMEPAPEILILLQRPYQKSDVNLSPQLWSHAVNEAGHSDWTSLCDAVRYAAEQILRERHQLAELVNGLSASFEAEVSLAHDQRRSRLQALTPTRETERSQLENELGEAEFIAQALLEGIRRPVVRLDAAGVVFLSGRRLEGDIA